MFILNAQKFKLVAHKQKQKTQTGKKLMFALMSLFR